MMKIHNRSFYIPLACILYTLFSAGLVYAKDDQPSVNKLQRLFTTPYERAQLDAMRRRGGVIEEQPESNAQAVLPPLQVKVKGLVVRKNAPNVVWVNDGNTIKSKTVEDRISVDSNRISKSNKIPIKVSGKRVKLQPGQVWNEGDNSIKDSYQVKQSSIVEEIVEQVDEVIGNNSDDENQEN